MLSYLAQLLLPLSLLLMFSPQELFDLSLFLLVPLFEEDFLNIELIKLIFDIRNTGTQFRHVLISFFYSFLLLIFILSFFLLVFFALTIILLAFLLLFPYETDLEMAFLLRRVLFKFVYLNRIVIADFFI
jgi:hypothetical protein